MREIKFRAWADGIMMQVATLRLNEDGSIDWGLLPKTLMQFTGLKDKNGKEIYEGDIIEYQQDNDHENDYPMRQAAVEYGHGAFHINGHYFMAIQALANDCAVIGNIYENPELLKV